MAFEGHLNGFTFRLDASKEFGGDDSGMRPKGLLLSSLAGCTAMDVIAVLNKMRQPVSSFEVSTRAELSETKPKRFTKITVIYSLFGEGLDPGRVRRAVLLSEEKMCGVSATLKPQVELEHEIWLNGERI